MNKIIWISAAVLSVAACAKNEPLRDTTVDAEVTYAVAPKTKGDGTTPAHQEFSKTNVFASWAYYLGPGISWDEKSDDPANVNYYPTEYISGAIISNNEKTGYKWKCADKSYYWPKGGGTLTFFAYSLNRDNLTFNGGESPTSHFECYSSTGINGIIDLDADPNVDFLVAEIAKEKRFNEENTYYVNGVPTLFKHKLSWIVFNVKAGSYNGKTFNLKSIKFKNVSHQATYCQVPTSSNPGGFKPTTIPNKPDVVYMNSEQVIPTDKLTEVTKKEHWLYIPQTFVQESVDTKNAYIEVKYTITTTVPVITNEGPSTKEVVEEVTKNIFLYPATGTPMFEKWEMGKKYTINLTFTLDEILWDPAVQDWDPVTPATDRVVE